MRYLLIVACVLISTSAVADWQVKEKKDSMTDEVRKSAYVTNDDGHTFSIYRISNGGKVWGNFSLSASVFDQISPQKPPIYRVDKNEPEDLDMRLHEAYEWNPKWVNFLIWHGKEVEGIGDKLIELMEGEKIVFRYYLGTGGYKETSFTLKGAASAISKAVGISEKVNHAKQEQANAFKEEMAAQDEKCKKNISTYRACLSQLLECMKKSNYDIQTLRQCLGQ